MISEFISGIFKPITMLASKMIMDKDKYAELQFKKVELEYNARSELLKQTTTPKIDAVVKLLITINDVVIPLLRPVGAAAMTAFGVWMHMKGTPMDVAHQVIFDGAFPAWGTSRHVNKQAETKRKPKVLPPKAQPIHNTDDWDWDEDY